MTRGRSRITLSFLYCTINEGHGLPYKSFKAKERQWVKFCDRNYYNRQVHQAFPRKKTMSCCAGNCGCGSACKCGNGCGGCKMYPDLSYSEKTATETLITGVAPEKPHFEGSETEVGSENGGCKCGDNCTCNPCNCK